MSEDLTTFPGISLSGEGDALAGQAHLREPAPPPQKKSAKGVLRFGCLGVLLLVGSTLFALVYNVRHSYYIFWDSRRQKMEEHFALADAEDLHLRKFHYRFGGQMGPRYELFIDEVLDYQAFCREQLDASGVEWVTCVSDGDGGLQYAYHTGFSEAYAQPDSDEKFDGYPVALHFCYRIRAGGIAFYDYDLLVVELGSDEYGIYITN